MSKDETELDWREFDRAMEELHTAWEEVLKVWSKYRRSLQEQAKNDFGAQEPRL